MGISVYPPANTEQHDEPDEYDDANDWSIDMKGRLSIWEPIKRKPDDPFSGPATRRKVAEFNEHNWGYVEVTEDDDDD